MVSIEEKLDIARKELLDLSFRNPLINFKLRKASGIGVYNINAIEVYNYLVNEGKTSIFTKDLSNNPSKLFSNINDKEIHERLTKTYRQNKLFLEEKGANVLFLALGFLKWNERINEDIYYYSPLILIPVELKRAFNQDRYHIIYSNEDIRFNTSLITKMNQEYNIDLDYDNDDIDIEKYLYHINSKIDGKRVNGWEVIDNEGALDFFSYAKYLMYLDLDINKWKKNDKFINADIINKLFNDGFNDKLTKNDANINDLEKRQRFYHVVDADSTQSLAIYDVNMGKNMVMQGPPGTGKSQTITNLIANSIALNKSILFVAEKKAALDVVKNRLERVGLSDLVLELHSNKANKMDVLKSINKTLNLGEPQINDNTQLFEKYNISKDKLNSYMELVNKPILSSNLSLVSIYGEALKIKDMLDNDNVRIPRVSFENIEAWSGNEYKERYDLVDEFSNLINNIGKIEKHPFYGCEIKSCLPYEQLSIKEKVNDTIDCLNSLIKISNEIGNIVGNKANTIFDSKRLMDSINYIKDFNLIEGINSADYRYSKNPEFVNEIVLRGIKIKEFYELNLHIYSEKAFKDKKFEQAYEAYDKISAFSKNKKKEALNSLIELYIDKEYKGNNYKNLLKELYKHKKSYKFFRENKIAIKEILKDSYVGLYDTDWNKLKVDVKKIINLHNEINNYRVVSQMKLLVMDNSKVLKLVNLNETFNNELHEFEIALSKFMDQCNFNEIKRFGYEKWYLDMSYLELRRIVLGFKDNIDRILEVVRYNELENKLYELKLDSIIDLYQESKIKYDYFKEILSFEYFDALINVCFNTYPMLQEFKKFRADKEVELFKDLDISIMIENIKDILDIHWKNMPKMNDDTQEMSIIRRELQKKRNQMPIRKLLSKTSNTIKKIKPVFMMSPLSIASYLTPGDLTFDLVIFDEASQVRPVEAFGALFRAKQIVVVGDSKQLPPTTFFDTMTNKYDELTDDDYDITNMESVLSLLLSKNIPERTLSWHYRSKHQSLIMLSNKEFYNSELKIFPSANDLDTKEGLIFNYHPETYYERGESRSNPMEAKCVINRVFEIIDSNPELSLGVVSFSMSQQEALYREFERQMKKRKNEELDKYFLSHENEPFFIKNLENVQGDERDIILISIGYGYDNEKHLTMDFGPLNKDGGERRLNVLITRAKSRCEVFSNINSYDINLSRTNATGVIVLKRFLEYAQNRNHFILKNDDETNESFIDYLYNKLIEYGYNVNRNIGVKGFGIDIAVVDPNDPNKYIVGIECDEGVYANLKSATDRERLRGNVLSNLGWKIYHIWTTDFYRNPKLELDRLLNYIELAANSKIDDQASKKKELVLKRKTINNSNNFDEFIAYKLYNGPKRRSGLLEEADNLSKLIEKVILIEAPIHIKELKRRILQITNVNKFNDQAKVIFDEALNLLDKEKYLLKDSFYFVNNQKLYIRNRSELDIQSRKMEYVSYDEIKYATYTVIDKGMATTYDEIKLEVSNALGLNKTNETLLSSIKRCLEELLNDGKIYIDNDLYFINDEIEE